MSKFLNKCLNKFKAKYYIKKYRFYREAKVVDSVVVKKQLQKIWKEINLDKKKKTFTM